MTTTISGNAKWDSCWRQACYLSKYIYKDPDVGFTTYYPEKMTEVEKNWDIWSEKNDHSKTGLVARLHKVKGWDPTAKSYD